MIEQLLDRMEAMETELAALRDNVGGPPENKTWRGVIVRGPNNEITPAYDRRRCWVKPLSGIGANDSSQSVLIMCRWITPVIGLPVDVGTMHGNQEEEVLGVIADDLSKLPGYTGQDFSSSAHGIDHLRRSTLTGRQLVEQRPDPTLIDTANIYSFQVRPSCAGGAAIDINGGKYFRNGVKVTRGDIINYSLASHLPGAGLQRYLAVWLNLSDNSMNYTNGSTVAINIDRPPSPVVTDKDALVLAYVRCYNGQTAVSETNDIEFVTNLIGANSNTTNVPYVNAGTGTQLTTNDDVLKSADIAFQQDVILSPTNSDTPDAPFHVKRTDNTAQVRVEDTGTLGGDPQLYLINANRLRQWYYNSADDQMTKVNFTTTGMKFNFGDLAGTDQIYVFSPTGGVSITEPTNSVEAILEATPADVNVGSGSNHALNLKTNDTDAVTIDTSQNLGIGTTSPQGRYHAVGANTIAKEMMWEFNDLAGTTEVIIPNAAGDVEGILVYQSVVKNSGAVTQVLSGSIAISANADIFDDGGGTDVFNLRVNADGSVDVRRTAGTTTADIALKLFWL